MAANAAGAFAGVHAGSAAVAGTALPAGTAAVGAAAAAVNTTVPLYIYEVVWASCL